MTSNLCLLGSLTAILLTCSLGALGAEASDQQIVYIRNTCECWSVDLKCVCKIESDPTSVRPLMQRLVNRTAEYYWQEIEFQSMVYDRTTFILANTFADGPFPSGITFKGDFSIVNDSFNHLNMTLNKVELNFETFSGRKPKFSKQYWRYIFDHGEGTLRSLRIIKYQIEDFIIPNYLGAALTQEVRPLTEFKVVGCEVKEVKERAFKNFTALEVLDLSDNHLTTLPENVFSRNINLQKILLANNQISFLTKTIFDGLPNLLLINLRKNKLTAVPAIPRHTNRRFQPMVYLMADNSIHCRCSLIWVLHELTFHHNLEIEATCSDPTMVRGMPIIEGFTRMDKEACYRLIRKEDGGASNSPPAIEGPTAGLGGSLAAPTAANGQASQPSETSAAAQLAAKSGAAAAAMPENKLTLASQDKLDGGVAAAAAAPTEPQLYKSGQTAANQMAPIASAAAAAAAVVEPAAAPQAVAYDKSLASLITHPTHSQVAPSGPSYHHVESQAQAVAPQTPVSGPDAAAPSPGAAVVVVSSSSAAAAPNVPVAAPGSPVAPNQAQQQQQQQQHQHHHHQQQQQLVNVVPQTILAPAQSAVISPVAAVAPAPVPVGQAPGHEQPHHANQAEHQSAVAQASGPAALVRPHQS